MTENICYLNRINQLSENDMRDFIVLHRMLEVEMSKSPEEMDLKLIDECSAQIDELAGEGPKHSSAVIQAKIQQILGEPTSRVSRNRAKVKAIPAVDTKNRHCIQKFFIILAASLLLLYSSLTVAAKMQGYSNAWEFVAQKFIEIFNLDGSKSLEEGNITLIVESKRISYNSIDALLRAEELNILYPSELPQNVSLTTVRKYIQPDGTCKFAFLFSDKNLSMTIKNQYTFDVSLLGDFEKIDMETHQIYIKNLQNGTFQALCQFEGYEYSITYNDYKEIVAIIESMKGLTS